MSDERGYFLYLINWWTDHYSRPMKDPILASYTLEELMYEFHSVVEHKKAAEERVQQSSDKIEEDKEDANQAWADAMEAEDAANTANTGPAEAPDNFKWMEEQIKKDQDEFGTDFGTDLDLEF